MYKLFMNRNEFQSWVNDYYNSYIATEKKCSHLKCYSYPNTGITVIMNTVSLKAARSKCTYPDSFDTNTGVAIAWARYIEMPIPVIIKYTSIANQLQTGVDFIVIDDRSGLYGETFNMLGQVCNSASNFCIKRVADNAIFTIDGKMKVGVCE